MTNNQSIEVEIVSFEGDLITIEGPEGAGDYKVVAPADPKYIKLGKATVKFDGQGNVSYVHMLKPASGFKSDYPKSTYTKPAYGGFNKAQAPQVPVRAEYKEEISRVRVFNHISLKDYETLYNELSNKEKITASQVFKTDFTYAVGELRENYYDAIIYTKEAKQ